MKKMAIVLVAALALAATVPAFAAVPSVKMSGNTVINNGIFPAGGSNSVALSIAGSEPGWSAEADLVGALGLGQYKVAFTDPLFRITMWGNGKSVSGKNDPFSFVSSPASHAGNMKVRTEVGPVVADFDGSNLFMFGSKQIAGHNLGIATKSALPLSGATVVAHDTTNVSGVALTAAVGTTVNKNQGFNVNNLGFGIKAVTAVPMLPNVTATASYKSQPTGAGFSSAANNDLDELFVEGMQVNAQTKFVGNLKHTIKTSDRSQRISDVVSASAYWRGSTGNQAWDDQFAAGKYNKNVAPAVYANVNRTMKPAIAPVTVLTVKGAMPVMPAVWANGSIKNELEAKKTTLAADAYYQAMPKLAVEPGATVTLQQGQNNKVDLRTKATYQMSTNGKLSAGYTVNMAAGVKTGDSLNLGYEVKF